MKSPSHTKPFHLVIFKVNQLGDNVVFLPVVQQLRLRDQELFVNDQELNSQYLDLTTKASRLVKLLDDAENARNAKEVGSALGKYMEAKKLYLHSRFAKEGIESLLDEVLPLK